MKTYKIFSLFTALFLTAFLALPVCAADWNLALQGDLNVTTDEDYTIISADSKGNPVETKNTITIADDVNATITLKNVAIHTDNDHGLQMGSGAFVTLNLIGENSILNHSDDSVPSIQCENSNLTITSETGGTLKLHDEASPTEKKPVPEESSNNATIDINIYGPGFIGYEIIEDDDVPLSDGKQAESTFAVEGNAQVAVGHNTYSESGTYIISTETVINGIHGWDIEALGKFMPFGKDYSDLILLAKGESLQNCRILKTKNKNISVIASGTGKSAKLTESKLRSKQLTEDVVKEDILHACYLSLGKNYKDNYVVRFHLGEEYAGRTVEIRTLENKTVVKETVTVSDSGIAAVTATAPGDFVLIAK